MPRGVAGTQMSGLKREHAKGLDGTGALCGARGRRWGVLTVWKPRETNCKRCLQILREMGHETRREYAAKITEGVPNLDEWVRDAFPADDVPRARANGWVGSLEHEERRSTAESVLEAGTEILVELLQACPELPAPNLSADGGLYLSWQSKRMVVSVEIDEDLDVEWWCCRRVEEGRANAERDLRQGSFVFRPDQKTVRQRAISIIVKAIRTEGL